MSSRSASIARRMVGTPFAKHGRVPGVGLDCVGVVIETARAVGSIPEGWDFSSYRLTTADGTLEARLAEFLDEVDPSEARAGDVAIFRTRKRRPGAGCSHAGVLSRRRRLVHACLTSRRVVETDVRPEWLEAGWRTFRFRTEEA